MAHDDGKRREDAASGRDDSHDSPTGMPRNWLMAVLLLQLRELNSYGYDLLEKAAAFGFAALNPGTLYRALRQMEKEGLVNSDWDTSGQGPARRIYSITDAGEAYLKLWAGSLEHYRRTMDLFFNLYTGRSPDKPGSEK